MSRTKGWVAPAKIVASSEAVTPSISQDIDGVTYTPKEDGYVLPPTKKPEYKDCGMPTLITQFAQESMDKANRMFGLDLRIKYRWEDEINGESLDIRPESADAE